MKNNITLINYANDKYRWAQRLNSWTGKHIAGFSKVIEYGPDDIDKDFYQKNKYILDQKRGNGMWLWKPYFIFKTLCKIDDGEYIFYCDTGSLFCRNFKKVFDSFQDEDVWVSHIRNIEKQWTKPTVFQALNADDPKITETMQIQASFVGVKKTAHSIAFIKEWLDCCCRAELIMPLRKDEERGDCIAHREDQSVFSVLCKKNSVIPHRDPTQYGKKSASYTKDFLYKWQTKTDTYSTIIYLHRAGNFGKLLKIWIATWSPTSHIYKTYKRFSKK